MFFSTISIMFLSTSCYHVFIYKFLSCSTFCSTLPYLPSPRFNVLMGLFFGLRFGMTVTSASLAFRPARVRLRVSVLRSRFDPDGAFLRILCFVRNVIIITIFAVRYLLILDPACGQCTAMLNDNVKDFNDTIQLRLTIVFRESAVVGLLGTGIETDPGIQFQFRFLFSNGKIKRPTYGSWFSVSVHQTIGTKNSHP